MLHAEYQSRFSNKSLHAVALLLVFVFAMIIGTLAPIFTSHETFMAIAESGYGSLEGRFDSKLKVEYNGTTYSYRDNSITTMLVLGIDRRDMNTISSDARSGGQADFLVLLVLDRKNHTVTPVQLDRDTVTTIKTYGVFGNLSGYRNTQICLAQAFGATVKENTENTAWAVSNMLLNIPIDSCVVMDMNGIGKVSDAVGGVPVEIEDDLTSISPDMVPGATVVLKGDIAEQYIRARKFVTNSSNEARLRRHRTYLKSFEQQVRGMMKTNKNALANLYDELSDDIYTTLTRGALLNQAYTISQYTQQPVQSLVEGERVIAEDGYREFYPDSDKLTELVLGLCFEVK